MEILSHQILLKFDTVKQLFEKIAVSPEFINSIKIVQSLLSNLYALEIKFSLLAGPLYVKLVTNEIPRNTLYLEFNRIIAVEGFLSDIDKLMHKCKNILNEHGFPLRNDSAAQNLKNKKKKNKFSSDLCSEIQRLIDIYPIDNIKNPLSISQYINYKSCMSCGNEMDIDSVRSELKCNECATIKPLTGIVFEDSQFYNQEGQKTKSGTFNPNRHFQFWWSHILAKEGEDELGDSNSNNLYGELILEELHKIIIRDRKVLRRLTVTDIRNMLREIKKTELNKNVPLLLKKLTGIGPPSLSEEIEIKTENFFTKAIELGEQLKRGSRVNRNYYPYYIYKILEQLIPDTDFESKRVLYYIYIQSKETVEADDIDWEQICLELVELNYKPTDRTDAMKYCPN